MLASLKRNIFFKFQTWAKIFSHLKDSNDLLACYHTCKRFRALLYPTCTNWMGPFVLQTLMERLSLDDADVRRLRQVSRRWRDGVDGLIQGENGNDAENNNDPENQQDE